MTWWCSHDIARDLTGFVELEYDLGLLTVDNQVKPAGVAFRDFARALRKDSISPPEPRTTALVLDDDTTPDLDFADSFFALIDQGVRPAIVLRSQINTPGHLELRGIDTVVEQGANHAGALRPDA